MVQASLADQGLSGNQREMKSQTKRWIAPATLVASFCILIFLTVDRIGIAPNVGLPFGYYGEFNRVLSHLEDDPGLKVTQTRLHRDRTLEDFYISVRTQDHREMILQFTEVPTRSLGDLLQELQKVGM